MGCNPCIDTAQVLQLLETLINKMLASGYLQAGLRDCDERRLGQDTQMVACAQLGDMVQGYINNGTLKLPADVHVGAVSFVDDYIVLRLTDGTEIRSETKIPEQVKPTAVTVDRDNYIIVTMSDGTELRSATPVETPEPVEVTAVTVDGDNHIVLTLSDGTTLRTATAVETPEPVKVTGMTIDQDEHIKLDMSDGSQITSDVPVPHLRVTDVTITPNNEVWLTMSDGTVVQSDSGVFTNAVIGVMVDSDNHVVVTLQDGSQYRSDTPVVTPAAVTVVDVALDAEDHIVVTLSDGTTVRSKTAFDTSCTFVDCNGKPIPKCGAVATCDDLQHIIPAGGTVGQVLTRTQSGTEWGDKTELADCNGKALDNGARIATCADLTAAIADVLPDGGTEGAVLTYKGTGIEWDIQTKPKLGEGVLYDTTTDTVSIDVDWLNRKIADLICPQSECQTWVYDKTIRNVPVLNSTGIYYVDIASGNGTHKTVWFGNGDETCYRYSAIVPGDGSATFELYVGEEQVQAQTVTGSGTVLPSVTVYRLTLVTEVTEAGTSRYADGAPGTVNETPVLNGVTVSPANRVFPSTGSVGTDRPDDRRWFYFCNLSTTLPADTYYIYAQADDSITLQLADVVSAYDFSGCSVNCTRSATFSVTTTKPTDTLYVDNHNNNLIGTDSPSWFALSIVNSAGTIVFNGVDPENKWLVTETTYGCNETS